MITLNRRLFVGSMLALSLSARTGAVAAAEGTEITLHVVRSPDCGCCGAWIDHLRRYGFSVEETLSTEVEAFKDHHAVPPALRSCHTALVEGYVIEGHVPAQEIQRLLDERPKVAGLAVPGMPIGSPGMEMGDQSDQYDVIAWTKVKTEIYARY